MGEENPMLNALDTYMNETTEHLSSLRNIISPMQVGGKRKSNDKKSPDKVLKGGNPTFDLIKGELGNTIKHLKNLKKTISMEPEQGGGNRKSKKNTKIRRTIRRRTIRRGTKRRRIKKRRTIRK